MLLVFVLPALVFYAAFVLIPALGASGTVSQTGMGSILPTAWWACPTMWRL